MRVFISWSGLKSRMVAEALRDWLPDVVNAVDPWMSDEDIEKGAVGLQEIATQLQGCSYGIVCLTRENQDRPWINYEAGALSKSVNDEKTRVATFLIDFDRPGQVTGPVSSFQATMPTLEDVTKLVVGVDQATGDPRERERVVRIVVRLWPELEQKIAEAQKVTGSTSSEKRSPDDMLEELLEIGRQTLRELSRLPQESPSARFIVRRPQPGLQERVQLSTRDAMDRDLGMIQSSLGHPIEYLYQVNDSGITLIVQGEYSDEATEAIRTAALQRGISVSFRRGVTATAEPPAE